MSITRIRIPSTFRVDNNSYAWQEKHGVADFTLGLGSCGKTVDQLEISFQRHGVEVVQYCTCTEQKVFVYPWHTITGRVEVTYA